MSVTVEPSSIPTAVPPAPRMVARQISIGFGTVALVAIGMYALLLGLIGEVAGLVDDMRRDEAAIRQSLDLATAVREQYIHIEHSLVEHDRSHLAHYEEWRERVRRGVGDLAALAPADEAWRAEIVARQTEELHEGFIRVLLPASERGDQTTLLAEHRRLEHIAEEAAAHADALARAVESRMAHSHVLATRTTRLALVGGGLFVVLVVLLSIRFTTRLRATALQPLEALAVAARRFGSGDFGARVGPVGTGELGALASAFDRMAEELAERERRLLEAERMAAIGQLAAGVAHELNNPIGIIRGYVKTMSPEGDPAVLREELQILDEEAWQCQRIAEDLISYARPHELRRDRIQTRPFLEEAIRRLGEGPHEGVVAIRLDAEPIEIEGDAGRLRQVVRNLVINAIEASSAASIVEITGRATRDGYILDVADRGAGIDVADRERIFEPFFSRRRGGTGLGLAVCLGIVGAHLGRITVLPREGGGTVFRVELPRRGAQSERRT